MDIRGNFIAGMVAGVAVMLAAFAPLHAAEPTVAGYWEQADNDGKVGGWFLMFERDGTYQGAIVRGFPKPGDPVVTTCTRCTDDQKNAPMLGLLIIRGMQRKGLLYENGTILDPRDGSIYKAKLELSPDGKNMTVRGFLGIELFGQSQVWRRLPDNAMPRTEIPEQLQAYIPAGAPAGGVKAGTANSKSVTPAANSKNSVKNAPVRQ